MSELLAANVVVLEENVIEGKDSSGTGCLMLNRYRKQLGLAGTLTVFGAVALFLMVSSATMVDVHNGHSPSHLYKRDDNITYSAFDEYLITDPDGKQYYIQTGCHDLGNDCTFETRRFLLNYLMILIFLSFCGCDRCYLGYGCCCCFWKPITLGGLLIWYFYDLASGWGVWGPILDDNGCCMIDGGFGFSVHN